MCHTVAICPRSTNLRLMVFGPIMAENHPAFDGYQGAPWYITEAKRLPKGPGPRGVRTFVISQFQSTSRPPHTWSTGNFIRSGAQRPKVLSPPDAWFGFHHPRDVAITVSKHGNNSKIVLPRTEGGPFVHCHWVPRISGLYSPF